MNNSTNSAQTAIMNNMIMMLMMAAGPSISAIVTAVMNLLERYLPRIFHWLKTKLQSKIHSITIRCTMTYSEKTSRWTTVPEESQNIHLIRSILEYMTDNSIYSDETRCNLGIGRNSECNSMKSRELESIPSCKINHEGFSFEYEENVQRGTDKCFEKRIDSITISSKKSPEEINKFIQNLYQEYVDKHFDRNNAQHYYKQIPSKEGIRFKKYPVTNNTTFDNLYFPEKDKILELINKLTSGELNKLSLLLHGKPGCGKTSIIKALSKKLGYSIIEIKLSFMMNDASLMDAFHNKSIIYHDNNDEKFPLQTDFIELDKRIYIFEDVDAECEVIHQRRDEEPVISCDIKLDTKSVDNIFSQIEKKWLKHGLTLSGILNVLDGVLEIVGAVIVMTTNHPDKLDEAFMRPGRITIAIEMKKMLSRYANEMIEKKYGSIDLKINDFVFTPALLESYCQTATNLDELQRMINDHQ